MDNPSVENKKGKKNVFIIILLSITLLVLCCCGSYAATTIIGLQTIMSEANEIQEDVLIPLCNNYPFLEANDMEIYFSSNYDQTSTDTKQLLKNVFPDDYNCDEIFTDGILDLFSKGQNFEINAGLNGTVADVYIVTVHGNALNATLVNQEEGSWKISSISLSE